MSTGAPLTDSARGYLSPESKRRFTLVAGVLGAAFFLAQFVLPFLAMLLFVFPTFGGSMAIADIDHAALWRGELWFVERTTDVNWKDVESSVTHAALRHVGLGDLSPAGPDVPLGAEQDDSTPALLPIGDRLWLIGARGVGYYESGALTRLVGGERPARASRPFVLEGRPAVASSGARPRLSILEVDDDRATWRSQDLPLLLPPAAGGLQALQAIEAPGGLYLFAELCTEEPEQCTISYRGPGQEGWLPLVEDSCSCASWDVILQGSRPAVVIAQTRGSERKLELVTVFDDGARRVGLAPEEKRSSWSRWRPVTDEDRLFLVSMGMPGSLSLVEMADGRPARAVKTKGSFPFGPRMMGVMLIPQSLPMVLSLLLALVLTGQMRRHRTPDYVFEGSRRAFATLWQRALAQLVDVVPLVAGFALPMLFMWRIFDEPERMAESGPMFVLTFLGLILAAFGCALLVLAGYSFFEGRSGRTPGKWLLGIRVLGTDLRPCGFGRALLRNVLTFVDGFFNFLVGTLLVALTDNWQRLGDLAARTIVVRDDRSA